MSDAELRDRFAMAALTGILNNPQTMNAVIEFAGRTGIKDEESAAKFAYKYADAMMNER